MHYLLNFELVELIHPGKKMELPLLLEEVQIYYRDANVNRNKQKEKAEALLEHTEYSAIEQELKVLCGPRLAFAEIKNDKTEIEKITNKIVELEIRKSLILNEKHISPETLEDKFVCEKCKDAGVIDGIICSCAEKRKNAIKAYCANLRKR